MNLFAIREQRTLKILITTIPATPGSIHKKKHGLKLLLTKGPQNEKKGLRKIRNPLKSFGSGGWI
jgi:hypothetical protein